MPRQVAPVVQEERAAFDEQILNKYNNIIAAGLAFLLLSIALLEAQRFCLLGRLLGRPYPLYDNAMSLFWSESQHVTSEIRKIEAKHLNGTLNLYQG